MSQPRDPPPLRSLHRPQPIPPSVGSLESATNQDAGDPPPFPEEQRAWLAAKLPPQGFRAPSGPPGAGSSADPDLPPPTTDPPVSGASLTPTSGESCYSYV